MSLQTENDEGVYAPSWWRRLLLRLAGYEPAAVWDTPDEPRVFYEDEEIPSGSMELWGRKLKAADQLNGGRA